MPGVSLKKECSRVTGADQPPMPLLKYSSRAQKSACRRVSILTTRMGIGGKKFDCVGGIKTQQRFGRPPLGWTGERMKYRTPGSQRTIDIMSANQYSLDTIGSRIDQKLQRRTQRASISALPKKDT